MVNILSHWANISCHWANIWCHWANMWCHWVSSVIPLGQHLITMCQHLMPTEPTSDPNLKTSDAIIMISKLNLMPPCASFNAAGRFRCHRVNIWYHLVNIWCHLAKIINHGANSSYTVGYWYNNLSCNDNETSIATWKEIWIFGEHTHFIRQNMWYFIGMMFYTF